MLRVSLLVLASVVHAQTPTRPPSGIMSRMPRSSALLSTQEMFLFWCNAEREKSTLCQQRVRSAKLGALQKRARAMGHEPHAARAMSRDSPGTAHACSSLTAACAALGQILLTAADSAERAALMKERTAMINEGKAHPIGSTRKEYLEMKARYEAAAPHCGAHTHAHTQGPHCVRAPRARAVPLCLDRGRTPALSRAEAQLSPSPSPATQPTLCAGGVLRHGARALKGSKGLVAKVRGSRFEGAVRGGSRGSLSGRRPAPLWPELCRNSAGTLAGTLPVPPCSPSDSHAHAAAAQGHPAPRPNDTGRPPARFTPPLWITYWA